MKPIEIKNNIFWVGAIDWDLRDFHGYSTEKGSSYNAYLLKDEKTVLFDTVKAELIDDLVSNLQKLTEPGKIDYIVVHHAEMDHTGALPQMIELVKPEKLFCSAKGKETLIAHFHRPDWPFETVSEGQIISTGHKTIQFFDSKMLHWPESMVSYIECDQLLITNDIFGQHWATSERFDDEVEQGELYWQSAKYYANIFLPFSAAAGKFLAKLKEKNLRLSMLACDHGLIWRKDVAGILAAYDRWSRQISKPKAVIVYDSMWGSTRRMAQAVATGIFSENISVQVFDLKLNHRSDIMTEILEARAVVLGSPVMSNGLLPKMADMLAYMKALRPDNKLGAAIGSYGWSDRGVKILNEVMQEMKFQLVSEGVSVNYVPTEDDLKKCEQLGVEIARAIKSS